MIAIIDYGMGNLRSVEKGFQKVGVDVRVVREAQAVRDARGIVLPGVGAFRDCMRNLTEQGLIEPIRAGIEGGKPFLGICLGLQVLFSESAEFGHTEGLGILPGKVLRFPKSDLKVPHMGWNAIAPRKDTPLLDGIPPGSFMYFVHSYYVAPDDPSVIATTTTYGLEFTSMVARDNIAAMQFHPEKSQGLGLAVLRNFGAFVARS
jgi:glutamine amidotransferase